MPETLLTPDQKYQLEQLVGDTTEVLNRRVRLLLLYDAGLPTREVSAQVGLSPSRTRYWRRQFRIKGMGVFPEQNPEVQNKEPEAAAVVQVTGDLSPSEVLTNEIPFPEPFANPGILPDDTLAEAGRKVMLFHFAEMLSHEAGTRLGVDAEELHDMRVATRRQRAAFTVFGDAFEPKAIKSYLKRLRAAGRALGYARDMDVIVEKARHYLDTITAENHPGLQPLLETWEEERTMAHTRMLAYLDSKKYQNFKQSFNVFLHSTGSGARPISQDPPTASRVREVAPVLIYSRLEAVRAYDTILGNATLAQLHALRIELKKFRYTVEFFKEVLGEQAKTIINELKTLQDHLGDLHDADVACQIIRQFLEKFDTHQAATLIAERKNPEPIVAYLAYRSAERHHLMVMFPQAWAHFNRPEFRLNLALAVAAL